MREIIEKGAGAGPAARVAAINPQEDPRWETFAAGHRDGLVFHHPLWLRVIEKAYGYEPVCLACEGPDRELEGILPLFRTKGLLTGRYLSSLPHTPVAGPLARSNVQAAALVQAAVELARAQPGTRLVIKSTGPGLYGLVQGVIGLTGSETYVLDLPRRPDELHFGGWRNHSRIKWAVNKATRSGLRVRAAETEAELRQWYALYLDAMRAHTVPPRPYRFFRAAWELLQPAGLLRLLIAEQQGSGPAVMAAGSIFLSFGRTVLYAFNGRRPDFLALRPNDLIQWVAIREACAGGFHRYDFGEVEETQKGLAQFKGKWGAEKSRLFRYYYPEVPQFETRSAGQGGRGRRIFDWTWRRMPLRATAFAGGVIYRHLVG